jgi:hypothetical protein
MTEKIAKDIRDWVKAFGLPSSARRSYFAAVFIVHSGAMQIRVAGLPDQAVRAVQLRLSPGSTVI